MDVVTERSQARPPYQAYAAIMGVYAGGLALAGAAARLLGRDPRDQTWFDLAALSAATFKAARTIVRDDVTSFIREPFVEGDPRDPEEGTPCRPAAWSRRSGSSSLAAAASARGPQRALRPHRCSHRVSAACSPGPRRRRYQRLPTGRLRSADAEGGGARALGLTSAQPALGHQEQFPDSPADVAPVGPKRAVFARSDERASVTPRECGSDQRSSVPPK